MTPTLVIKVTGSHLEPHLFLVLDHQKLFIQMFGILHQSFPLIIIITMWFLLTILQKNTWFYPLKQKFDVTSIFEWFKNIIENFFDTSSQTVYSNGGGEYQSLSHTLSHFGIQRLKSPPHTL